MSDTIIVYENGKAIGGEGHPTNANEITFNNEDTDLISEETESAIKEVNAKFDKGSVSVTADGVKTFGDLLNEINVLIDTTKLNVHSILARETSPNGALEIAYVHMLNASAHDYGFTTTTISYSGGNMLFASNEYRCQSTGSSFLQYTKIQGSNETFNNISTNVPTSGIKITIYY